ncbi:uncharacterized protein LOC120648121 [Panicum virgatum]|uniref:uncharacterized protein LOC120648121 n=1 Tax=Panicum virgatum TaxID=38727 RepID=UPI0019D62C52|nr:uncharacterized protein LOC120648121 [Panicum virgatum]
MSRFGKSLHQQWDEDDESDDDDLLILDGLIEGSKRNKRKKNFRGSLPGRHSVQRGILEGNLGGGVMMVYFRDYFVDPCVYNNKHFRRRFRMSISLFLRIIDAVESHDDYFCQKPNAVGALGGSPIQKSIVAVWMLAYGVLADFLDDYVRLGESTIIECLKHFVKAFVEVFSEQYLRAPNAEDTARLMAINHARGWPGMLGSIDCMHWKWDKCPTAWRGAYTGHKDGPTMILEAVASQDLWIWHTFFGLLGSLNDINVLCHSPLFQSLTSGKAPELEYIVNGNKYNICYYLADGIYPTRATFVKAFHSPQGNKKIYFTSAQQVARKDVERAFGVLQSRFAMVRALRGYGVRKIVEDEREEPDFVVVYSCSVPQDTRRN